MVGRDEQQPHNVCTKSRSPSQSVRQTSSEVGLCVHLHSLHARVDEVCDKNTSQCAVSLCRDVRAPQALRRWSRRFQHQTPCTYTIEARPMAPRNEALVESDKGARQQRACFTNDGRSSNLRQAEAWQRRGRQRQPTPAPARRPGEALRLPAPRRSPQGRRSTRPKIHCWSPSVCAMVGPGKRPCA